MAKRRSDGQCCSAEFVKGILHAFNVLFLLTGLAVLAIALWTLLTKYQYVTLLSAVIYPMLTYFLLAAGALVVAVAFLGFCATCKENRKLLMFFVFLLLLIFLLEAMVGVLAFIYREQVNSELEMNLNSTFSDHYKIDDDKTRAIDSLQEQFKCCGAASFEEWQFSRWKMDNPDDTNKVPDSCCKTVSFRCGYRDHPSNINYIGCLDRMSQYLQDHLGIISAVGLGICIIQVFGMMFACCLYFKLREEDEDQPILGN